MDSNAAAASGPDDSAGFAGEMLPDVKRAGRLARLR